MFVCGEVTELSDAFVDDELFGEVQARILYHLRDCNTCAALVAEKIGLKRLVRASVRNLTVPAFLRQSVRRRMGV